MSSIGVADSNPQVETLRFASLDNLVAKASGGQQVQTPINAAFTMHRFVTVASNNDSATLPPATGGQLFVLTNAHASNSMNVFPNKGDQINAVGANNAFALANGKVALFISTAKGQWHSILTA